MRTGRSFKCSLNDFGGAYAVFSGRRSTTLERQRGPPSRIGSQQPGSPNQDGPSSVGAQASSLIQYQVHLRIHGVPGGDQRRAANEDGDGCDVRDPHDVAPVLSILQLYGVGSSQADLLFCYCSNGARCGEATVDGEIGWGVYQQGVLGHRG